MRSNACLFALGISTLCGLAACSSSSDGGSPPESDGGGAHDSGVGTVSEGGGGSETGTTNDGGVGTDSASTQDSGSPSDSGTGPETATAPADAVYTMTNAAAGNAILGFTRAADGSLTPMAAPFPTAGKGSGAGLGEQGALILDAAGGRVFAVNAGDASFSILPVGAGGALEAAVNVSAASVAGGAALIGPKSVTVHGNTVYVLFEGNATTPSAIAGWTVSGSTATFLAGSILPLSSATESVDPAQIQFTPDGGWLVVTEKQSGGASAIAGAGSIDTFAVDGTGLATKKGFYATASAGADAGLEMTPFGFDFHGSTLIVSLAGSTGTGTYTYADGVIAPVAGATQFLPTDPAPCWVQVSADRAYVANAHGPDVSGFTVGASGGLTAIGSAANAVVAPTGNKVVTDAGTTFNGPTDEAMSSDGKFLYVLDGTVPAIGAFQVNADGSLTRVGSADYTSSTLVAGLAGLAAR